MPVVHDFDRARQEIKRNCAFVRRHRSGFQRIAPRIGKFVTTSPNEVRERLYFAAIGLKRLVLISITSETKLDKRLVMAIGRGSRSIYLSVAIRWFITAQACSWRAFLITNICSAKHSHTCGNVRLDTLPTRSAALVVPTRELIKGWLKIIDSTAFRAEANMIEASMIFLRAPSISVEWTAAERRVSYSLLPIQEISWEL